MNINRIYSEILKVNEKGKDKIFIGKNAGKTFVTYDNFHAYLLDNFMLNVDMLNHEKLPEEKVAEFLGNDDEYYPAELSGFRYTISKGEAVEILSKEGISVWVNEKFLKNFD